MFSLLKKCGNPALRITQKLPVEQIPRDLESAPVGYCVVNPIPAPGQSRCLRRGQMRWGLKESQVQDKAVFQDLCMVQMHHSSILWYFSRVQPFVELTHTYTHTTGGGSLSEVLVWVHVSLSLFHVSRFLLLNTVVNQMECPGFQHYSLTSRHEGKREYCVFEALCKPYFIRQLFLQQFLLICYIIQWCQVLTSEIDRPPGF